jgi:hypothetical protein
MSNYADLPIKKSMAEIERLIPMPSGRDFGPARGRVARSVDASIAEEIARWFGLS